VKKYNAHSRVRQKDRRNTVLFCYPEATNSGFTEVASNFTCHPVNAAHIEEKCPKSPRKRTAEERSRAFPRFGNKSTVRAVEGGVAYAPYAEIPQERVGVLS
jgi:hypothetical protein